MITVSDLEMRFGPKVLFKSVNLQLMPGSRYGLVGANGSGKSTFLKVLSGQEIPTGGKVQLPNKGTLGVLNQDQFLFDELSLIETVMMGKPKLHQAMKRMDELLAKEDFSEAEGEEVGQLECVIADEDGYAAEAQAAQLLEGLGIPTDRHEKIMKELSGGYKLRVLLAQVLFSDPDMLFLDEPTNHLDLYSIRWLEAHLCKVKAALVVISHDRDFINGVSTHILDVDFGSIRCYKGNYEKYLKQVAEDRAQREATIEKAEKRKDDLQEFVDRFKAKASKAKQAQSKMRMIDKLNDELDDQFIAPSSRRFPKIGFDIDQVTGAVPLKVDHLSMSYGQLKVLNQLRFEVDRGECLAVVGPNGIGKSTLLKILTNNIKATKGDYKWGHHVKISYFPQDIEAEFSGPYTALQWINDQCPSMGEGQLRKCLARSLFSGDDSEKSIATLSGGERARLILAKMMAERSNVLIFDEPTNHLDLEAIEALENAVKAFDGTVLLVSHNRWFVSNLATRVLEILPDELRVHSSYDDLLQSSSEDHLSRDVSLKSRSGLQKQGQKSEEDIKKLREKERQLKNKMSKCEKEIEKTESQIARLDQEMLVEGFYDEDNAWKRKQTLKKHQQLQDKLQEQTQEWEGYGKEVEALSLD
jgi:ATPase subunit of ABC transporter with duplicated ATPase domains